MRLLFISIVSLILSFSVEGKNDCGIHPKAQELANMLIESNQQQRLKLTCNMKLAQAAAHKAKLMAEHKQVAHVLDYMSPNRLLIEYGVKLPRIYEVNGNQVEAISGGKTDAKSTFDYFMSSAPHKSHLLGEGEFYKTQNQIAVGYYYDFYTPHEHYWVVYVTGIAGDELPYFSFMPAK